MEEGDMARFREVSLRVIASACAVFLLSAFASPTHSSNVDNAHAVLTVSSLHAPVTNCQTCEDAQGGGGVWGHSFQSPGAQFACGNGDDAGCHVEWLPGTCGSNHSACIEHDDDGEDVLASAERVATGGDAESVKSFLNSHSKAARYNADRRAIQLIGCSGKVVAQFALAETTAAALQ